MTADATEDRRIGDPDPRVVRRERKRWLIAVVIIVVVAVPSIFYFSGAYDRWQDGRSLADSCRGSVDTSEVRELLGVDRLRAHDVEVEQGAVPSSGQLHKCSVRDPDAGGWLSVGLDWGSDAAGALHDFNEFVPYGDVGMAIPLGHGWQGVMDEGHAGQDLVATVNMPCTNHRSDPKRSSLIVTVKGTAMRSVEGATQRARFARTTVKTAQNAAKAWGCTVVPGGVIDRVPDNTAHSIISGKARGTCAGIEVAVRESVTDSKSPIENCYYVAESSSVHNRVSAFYGPFAPALREQLGYDDEYDPWKPAGRKGDAFWASAQCPSGSRALYITTRPVDHNNYDSVPSEKVEKAALKEFATRSAKRHGCTDLKLP
ncbi:MULTISPECIES: hypothetical protein [Streptomyces]|uniref:hypothetical protein n=1 Tax=Streptomyces TaxID=1883 RepID=UPI0034381E7A